jgi:hypothetical protein
VRATITNGSRSRDQYNADLELDGSKVGTVEKGMNMGGYRASYYVAKVGATVIAAGRTLQDLREDLRDPLVLTDIEDAVKDLEWLREEGKDA